MARYIGSKQKLQRKIGEDLGLKTNAIKTAKRLMSKPGPHGAKMHRKLSDYGVQLKEKQKVKHIYGLLEKQMRKMFDKASSDPLKTGSALLSLIERRLDNVIYRLGFAPTRASARQMVAHDLVLVNDGKMNIPSYLVKTNDVVKLKEKATKIPVVAQLIKAESANVPAWLSAKGTAGKVLRFPDREDIKENINEQLIVEYYNR